MGGRPTYQLACYPGGGARYVRHADASVSCPSRTVTAIVYLNAGWDVQVGFGAGLVDTAGCVPQAMGTRGNEGPCFACGILAFLLHSMWCGHTCGKATPVVKAAASGSCALAKEQLGCTGPTVCSKPVQATPSTFPSSPVPATD